MKKKPPPGATLIARLKERRLQKEQELKSKSSPLSAEEAEIDVEANELAAPTEAVPVVQFAVENKQVPVQADLLHRSISIEDLRPTTDDYDALTDEIRLAGRFAAVGLIAQGLRLSRIHQAEIHKVHYGSFEEYCRQEHQMSATYVYRLIRMSEMAEKMAIAGMELSRKQLPDPFEVLLGLGHRHLMALLPVPQETTEEFLTQGIPLVAEDKEVTGRIPIDKATEQQIKSALKLVGGAEVARPRETKKTIEKELAKLAKSAEQHAEWLEDRREQLALAAMEDGAGIKDLSQRLQSVFARIIDILDDSKDES
ncbi:MAG: hypothetical protein K2W82_16395 [Candidatus Obscuribacterales bacterium]|nr:hypothetical protein [Candidatus Obscuribacterales bacterium]